MKIKWILLTTLVLGAALFFYLKFRKSSDFGPLIKSKLINMVHKASNGLYVLTIDDLEMDVLQATTTLIGVSIKTDSIRMKVLDEHSQLPDDIFNVEITKLYIDGLSPVDFINANIFDLQQIRVDSPNILVTHEKRNYNKKDTSNFYSRIAPNQESYAVKLLLLNNSNVRIVNKDRTGITSTFKNMSVHLADIKIDKGTINDSTRFLFAKDANLYLGNYIGNTSNKKYTFSLDSVALKPQLGTMNVKGLRLKPVETKSNFTDQLRFQDDRFDISVNEINIKNMNWWSLLSNDGLFADAATLTNGYLKVYRDKTLPLSEESKVGKFPHQELMKLDFPIHMKELFLQNMNVSYEEFNPKSQEAGKIEFMQVNGDIQNISNMPDVVKENNWMKVSTSSLFMNQAQLDATFNFDLSNAAYGSFTVNTVLGKMEGTQLNQITEGLGLVKIEKLDIEKLSATVNGNNIFATADVSFAYRNLKVSALKKDDDNNFKKKGLASFMANSFLINDNSDGKKIQTVRLERDTRKSFFNLIWKTIYKGLNETVTGK